MKNLYLLLGCVLASFSLSAQTILNPSFEDWSEDEFCFCDTVDHWRFTSEYGSETYTATKSKRNNAKEGNYSVLVQKQILGMSEPLSQALVYENSDNNAFAGYYKAEFDVSEVDSSKISVHYKKGNKITKSSSTYISQASNAWKYFQVSLDKDTKADSIIIEFWATQIDTGKTKLWIDDIAFGMFVNTDEPTLDHTFNVFPNPANSVLNINFRADFNDGVAIQLNDLTGKEVFNTVTNAVSYGGSYQLNTANLPRGVYVLSVSTANGMSSEKIILE